ncbi:MAG TPA: TetR family transcriptional regulator C-terminal domain-containing protein [Gemmatimonadaceae bacterium]
MTVLRSADHAPLTPKGRATRARIVDAAAALIFERGVSGTSLDDVKAAASVSSSQLYHYFADKVALVSAVIAHQVDAVLGGQEPYLSHLDSMAALRAWRDAVVRVRRTLNCHGGCPIGSLASELAESDNTLRREAAAGFSRWAERIRVGLHAMRERGELRAEADPAVLATAILASTQGGILLSQAHRSTAPLEIALDTMLDYVASFLTPRGQKGRRAGTGRVRVPNRA